MHRFPTLLLCILLLTFEISEMKTDASKGISDPLSEDDNRSWRQLLIRLVGLAGLIVVPRARVQVGQPSQSPCELKPEGLI